MKTKLFTVAACTALFAFACHANATEAHVINVSGWSNAHCVNLPGVGIRTPVRFFSKPEYQEIRVDHVMRPSGYGLFCAYMVSVADTTNQTTSGQLSSLTELPGPGLVFSAYHWHAPSITGALSIRTVNIRPFPRDEIVVSASITEGKHKLTTFDIWAANYLDWSINVVHIASPGSITMSVLASGFAIASLGQTLRFDWDRDARQLKLLNPSPENIRLYDRMQAAASKLTF